jgi:hypothetical protein
MFCGEGGTIFSLYSDLDKPTGNKLDQNNRLCKLGICGRFFRREQNNRLFYDATAPFTQTLAICGSLLLAVMVGRDAIKTCNGTNLSTGNSESRCFGKSITGDVVFQGDHHPSKSK